MTTRDSDVDVLIDRGNMAAGWTIGGLYVDLRDAFGKELDLITTTCNDKAFLSRIKQDEVTLYES